VAAAAAKEQPRATRDGDKTRPFKRADRSKPPDMLSRVSKFVPRALLTSSRQLSAGKFGPIHAEVDRGGLLELSVVYTDRALNHMSANFQRVMTDCSAVLKEAYNADSVAIIPGSGTYAMEAVVRQLTPTPATCAAPPLIIRNGWFSFRWTQIYATAYPVISPLVVRARRVACASDRSASVCADCDGVSCGGGGNAGCCANCKGTCSTQSIASCPSAPFAPPPLQTVVEHIRRTRPPLVFAPHVETSTGIMLSEQYIKQLAAAAAEVGAMLVLDCIASGCMWVDMRALGVDVVITAPQKGWSGPPCAGFVMMSQRARRAVQATCSDSFSLDLKKWCSIMETYESGGHAYHATMPTMALRQVRDALHETRAFGLAAAAEAQAELGAAVRHVARKHGLVDVACAGSCAPTVVVSRAWHGAGDIVKAFGAKGVQVAAGVPLELGEGADYKAFRIGLFGLDKLANISRTAMQFEAALKEVKNPS
jgi:aspartate aminotransferase-like enzyme